MFKGLSDLAGLMKNAQEIKGKLETFKASLAETPVEGMSGGGMIRIKGRADGTVISVELDEATVSRGDKEMLEDLMAAAMNHFQEKVGEIRKEKMVELSSGLGLPAGMDLGL
jgi:DNA-binding YbaB/EbfC family protein